MPAAAVQTVAVFITPPIALSENKNKINNPDLSCPSLCPTEVAI